MHKRTSRLLAVALAIGLSAASAATGLAQGRAATAPDATIRNVRTALGHGAVDEARRLAAAGTTTPTRELGQALVEMFEGRSDAARTRLQALVDSGATGDPVLELGLLDMRTGHRDEGRALLNRFDQAALASTEDFLRLARAARALNDFGLAGDALQRIINVPGRPDIQTESGDLLREHDAPADAMTSYRAALDADPSWVRAHLGIARLLADEDPKTAAAELEAARRIAPEDPDVWLLVAERGLASEDPAGAAEALDHVARSRPGSLDEVALRAAVAYAQHQPPAVEAAVAEAQRRQPGSGLVYRRLGEEAARSYRFDEAAGYARQALAADADDIQAHADLGLYLLRTGDEKTARTELETAFKLDDHIRVTFNLLKMLDSLDKFVVVPDGNLVFKFAPDEAAVLKPYALPLGELAYKTFSERYGLKPQGPVLIEIFPQHDDFAVRTLGLPGLVGALGACFGRVVTMDSPHARPPGDFSWQATLWHEMAHVFTLQLSDYRVPRWLTEGLSVFEEHRRQAAWGRELTLQYAQELSAGKTFGVKGLPDAFKRPEDSGARILRGLAGRGTSVRPGRR